MKKWNSQIEFDFAKKKIIKDDDFRRWRRRVTNTFLNHVDPI